MAANSAFAPHASGLIVPQALARRRIAIPREDWKHLDRAVKVFKRLEVAIAFQCKNKDCKDRNVQRLTDHGGAPVLRCGCTDRVMLR